MDRNKAFEINTVEPREVRRLSKGHTTSAAAEHNQEPKSSESLTETVST